VSSSTGSGGTELRGALWQGAGTGASRLKRGVLLYLRATHAAVRAFGPDLIMLRAYALTFQTLLAVVPCLAVALSVLQAFGGLDAAARALESELFENLAPGTAAEVSGHIRGFVDRISAGAIGGAGVVALLFTAVSLLAFVEQSFDALWNIDRVRPFFSRFVTYWSMVTVGPVLFALSLTMTSAAQSHAYVEALARLGGWTAWAVGAAFGLVPWLITCAGMVLLYMTIPNTHVAWRAAAGGGVLAGTLWEIGKLAFTWASAHLFSYDAVYGSFGALPAFLLWLQVGWIIVLLGCKVAYGLQHAQGLRDTEGSPEATQDVRDLVGVLSMLQVARAHLHGEAAPRADALAAVTGAPLEVEEDVLARLVRSGLLVRIADGCEPGSADRSGEPGGEGLVPARDAARITVADVLAALRSEGGPTGGDIELEAGDPPAARFAREILARSQAAASAITAELTIAEAVERIAAGDERRGSTAPRPPAGAS
jgi:membrane protein